jgi:hypothetical protein
VVNTVRPPGHRQASVDPIQIDATEPPRAVTRRDPISCPAN